MNKDIPNQPEDHLPTLTRDNEKEWLKKLYLIRKRRFDELVEFDKRILEEGRQWNFYDEDPDQWKSNVLDKAALLAAAGLGAATAMDAMAED